MKTPPQKGMSATMDRWTLLPYPSEMGSKSLPSLSNECLEILARWSCSPDSSKTRTPRLFPSLQPLSLTSTKKWSLPQTGFSAPSQLTHQDMPKSSRRLTHLKTGGSPPCSIAITRSTTASQKSRISTANSCKSWKDLRTSNSIAGTALKLQMLGGISHILGEWKPSHSNTSSLTPHMLETWTSGDLTAN
jgi:hypothetical protein